MSETALNVGPIHPMRRSSRGAWPAMLVAAAVAMVAFAPTRHNAFVYDDLPIVAHNSLITEPGAWYRFWLSPWWPPGTSSDKLYRPLTLCTFRINAWLADAPRLQPQPFHTVNIALHALTAAGVALAAYRLTRRSTGAWIAGLLFAVHPVNTEAVATIVGRAELLCACFSVWLLTRYLGYVTHPAPRGISAHLINVCLYTGAVMSKEQGLLLWPALVLAEVLCWRSRAPADRSPWRSWFNRDFAPAQLGLILATAVYLYLRYRLFGWTYTLDASRIGAWEAPLAHASDLERWLTPMRLTWLAVQMAFWPGTLCPMWSVPALLPADHLTSDVVAGLALWIAMLGLWLWSLRRLNPLAVLISALMLMLCVPVHVLPLAHWLFAERWLYLPAALAAMLVALPLARLRGLGISLALAATLALLPSVWQYGVCFADTLGMSRETVRRQPDNYQGHRNVAILLYRGGQYSAAIQEAFEMIERFDRHKPWSERFGRPHMPYMILALSFVELGDGDQALAALDEYDKIRAGILEYGSNELREKAKRLIERASAATSPAG